MAGIERKLNVLSIDEKMKILKFLDGNPLMKESEIAVKFVVPASTISTIIKNREVVEHSESAFLPDSVCEEWIKDIPALVKGYEPKNIFSADEMGLFYQSVPDKTAMFKDESKAKFV
ncbi:hypothetical protein AVEN_74096-1 [Araneus ventricosus]|uniref:HTH psq-type domain-containing protein n=1 Tax=Araneus ventricosus TaxID=182803 RepID=A0A4Y2R521_ARAVE|nr:hypothetical protein AVEN_74096-1 [Araneus ventricosus]